MKKIRNVASNPLFLVLLALNFLVVSCSNDGGANSSSSELSQSLNKRSAKITGEELFKSIIFADGVLTKELPSLKSISNIDNLKSDELAKYKSIENEAIVNLKKIDANYFTKFQASIYTKDPETISKSIKQISTDLMPFFNQKLSNQNLTVEKISKSIKKDAAGNIDIEKSQEEMGLIPGAVLAIAVAVVAVAAFYVVAISEFWVGKVAMSDAMTLEAISIQIAQAI